MWLQAMKPRYWFAGHLHVHFAAAVPHSAPGNRPGPGSALPPPSGGLFQHGRCCVPELRHLVAQHSMLSSWKRLSASWCEVFCPTVG